MAVFGLPKCGMSPIAELGARRPWPLVVFAGCLIIGLLAMSTAIITLAGLGRLSSSVEWTAVPSWLWYYRGDPQLRRWFVIGVGSNLLLILALSVSALARLRRPLHGAARWATRGDIRRAGLTARTGILLGRTGDRPLVFGGHEHVLLHAPTRSGKGVGVVIPNLLTWPGPVVVLDIKRENWTATAGYRQACGQTVHLFDPLEREGRTARYNPLGHIDRDDPVVIIDELQKVASILFPASEHADPFWSEAARTGFISVGAYVAETPSLPFTLGEVLRQITTGDPHQRLPELVSERAGTGLPLSAPCVRAIADFTAAADKTFASVRQTITSRLALWINPRVDAATSASDFRLSDLRGSRTSIYLAVAPSDIARTAPLLSLVLQQLIALNARTLLAPDEPSDLLVVLDEFARLGRADVLAHAFAYIAGYGVRMLAVLQSPAQLKAIYGQDVAEEIMSNCAVEIAFAPKELAVAKELSDRLGTYTYRARATSRPTGLAKGGRSESVSDQRRPLMLVQELMQLGPDRLVILKAGNPPILGSKLLFWRYAELRRRITAPPLIAARPLPTASTASPSDSMRGVDPQRECADLAILDPSRLPGGSRASDILGWLEP